MTAGAEVRMNGNYNDLPPGVAKGPYFKYQLTENVKRKVLLKWKIIELANITWATNVAPKLDTTSAASFLWLQRNITGLFTFSHT